MGRGRGRQLEALVGILAAALSGTSAGLNLRELANPPVGFEALTLPSHALGLAMVAVSVLDVSGSDF